LPRVEVIRRLRDRHEPILLFGEAEEDACKRLRQLELDEPEKVEGIRNDFRYVDGLIFIRILKCLICKYIFCRDAMNKVDEVYLQEVLKAQVLFLKFYLCF